MKGRMLAQYTSLGLLLLGSLPLAADDPVVIPIPGRDFGYVIGDIVQQRFSVVMPKDSRLEYRYLPSPGPVEDTLELREIVWQTAATDSSSRFDFEVNYQIFKGVREAETVDIPSFTLHFAGMPPVPSPVGHFTLNPLIPAKMPDEQVVIKDVTPSLQPQTRDFGSSLWYGTGLITALSLLALRRGWFRLLRRQPTPFEHMLATIPPSFGTATHADNRILLLHGLHRAFNETAGHTVLAHRLEDFLQAHPDFKPLEAEIRWFFACSGQTFFTITPPEPNHDDELTRLLALCQACARAARSVA